MSEAIRFTIDLPPRSKKNSQQIYVNKKTGRPFITPSDAYKAYRKACLMMIPQAVRQSIDYPVNIRAHFYMQTRRKCDLVNLLEALLDVLVDARVIQDDNFTIAAAHDGSRVLYSKDHPRTEVTITRIED